VPPAELLKNSQAALMLSGLIQNDGTDPEDLKRRLLSGRYSEIRMLFFLGRDILRWLDQCSEWALRIPELAAAGIRGQSFAGLLTVSPPAAVKDKLIRWGVADYVSIFSQATGLNAIFQEPAAFESLAEEFLRNYHRYADSSYRCFMESQPHAVIAAANFRFDLYASGEYMQLLEKQWGGIE